MFQRVSFVFLKIFLDFKQVSRKAFAFCSMNGGPAPWPEPKSDEDGFDSFASGVSVEAKQRGGWGGKDTSCLFQRLGCCGVPIFSEFF